MFGCIWVHTKGHCKKARMGPYKKGAVRHKAQTAPKESAYSWPFP